MDYCTKCKKIVSTDFCAACGTEKTTLTKCPKCGRNFDDLFVPISFSLGSLKVCPECGQFRF